MDKTNRKECSSECIFQTVGYAMGTNKKFISRAIPKNSKLKGSSLTLNSRTTLYSIYGKRQTAEKEGKSAAVEAPGFYDKKANMDKV